MKLSRTYITVTFIMLFHTGVISQPTLEWENRFDSDNNNESPVKLSVNSQGDCFIAGQAFNEYFVDDNIVFLKVDAEGNSIWNNFIINDEDDRLIDMVRDTDDNMYISGQLGNFLFPERGFTLKANSSGVTEWIDTAGGLGASLALDDANNLYVVYDVDGILLIKYNSQGEKIWEIYNDTVTGMPWLSPRLISINKDHTIFIAGTSTGSNDSEYFLKKFSAAGNFLWDVKYNPSTESDNPKYIAFDDSAYIYILGNIEDGTAAGGIALLKYDSSGNFLWDQQILSFTSNSFGLVIDTDHAPIICGYHSLEATKNYFVIKYSPEGDEVWTQLIDTVNYAILRSASLTSDHMGGIYFTCALNGPALNYAHIFLAKYNSLGEEIWQTRYNSPSNGFDIPIQIKLDGNHNVYVTAWSDDSITNGDILTLKYSQPTGIFTPLIFQNTLDVSPNPFHYIATIQILQSTFNDKNLRIEIFDLPGKLIRKENIQHAGNYTLNREALGNGMYLVKLISENKVVGTAKIIIQ